MIPIPMKVTFSVFYDDVFEEACFLHHHGYKLSYAAIMRRLKNRFLEHGLTPYKNNVVYDENTKRFTKKYIEENFR